MARTSNAKILEWGTPPEPEPTGWDAIRIELGNRPGEWANIGEFTTATARKLAAERFRRADGYDVRTAPGKTDNRVAVWVRFGAADDDAAVETRDAAAAPIGAETADALASGYVRTTKDAAASTRKTPTAKRGGVV